MPQNLLLSPWCFNVTVAETPYFLVRLYCSSAVDTFALGALVAPQLTYVSVVLVQQKLTFSPRGASAATATMSF